MSETQFGDEPPRSGTRVEIVHGPPPRAYVVRTWINGKLEAQRSFDTQLEAEQYRRAIAAAVVSADRS